MCCTPVQNIFDLHDVVGIRMVIIIWHRVAIQVSLAETSLSTNGIEFWTMAMAFPACSQNLNSWSMAMLRSSISLDALTLISPISMVESGG